MDFNKEYINLVKNLIKEHKEKGKKLTKQDIATTLGHGRAHWNNKLSAGGPFTEQDLIWLKYKFNMFDERTNLMALDQRPQPNLESVASALEELADVVRKMQKQNQMAQSLELGKKASVSVGEYLKRGNRANTDKSGKDHSGKA
jgi:hypothetical protein